MGDIFAVEEVVAVDFLYLLIYFGLYLGNVLARSNAHHHTTAIGLEHTVFVLGTHVEYRTIE